MEEENRGGVKRKIEKEKERQLEREELRKWRSDGKERRLGERERGGAHVSPSWFCTAVRLL